MTTIKDNVKQYAKENGLKMYEIANLMGITSTTLYHCYLQTTSDKKLAKIKNAIDEYVANNSDRK